MDGAIEFLGSLAGVCTTFAFIPQVLHVWKTRSVKDISLLMYFIFCSGLAMWIVYACYIQATPLIVANTITFVLASIILVMKLMWNKT